MKLKVKVYMKSGNKFSFKCDKFEISKLSCSKEDRKASWENADGALSIDVGEVEAVIIKRVLF